MVRLLIGPARSDRAQAIDDLFIEHWGRALLIVPTAAYAAQRRRQILERSGKPGIWGARVVTFQGFVSQLLGDASKAGFRIDPVDQHLLLRRTLDGLADSDALRAVGPAAATEGFVNHAQHVIAQLKQSAIEPEAFRRQVADDSRARPIDRAIAVLYDAYQKTLRDAYLFDLQGQYWQARDDCMKPDNKPGLFDAIDTLLLDEFDDFTPSEFRLLEAAQPHLKRLVFGLNYDPAPSQEDVYAIVAETARKIERSFETNATHFAGPPPSTCAEYASDHLFWRERPPDPAGLEANVHCVEAHGPVHEIETIARRIKGMLIDDTVPADEIALVSRSLADIADTVRHVFDEFGLPLRLEREFTLADAAVAAYVLNFIEAVDTWERDLVTDVLGARWFPRDENAYSAEIAGLARTAQIICGFDQWKSRIERLQERIDTSDARDMDALRHRMPHASAACSELRERVAALHALGAAVPASGTVQQFAEAVDELLDTLGLAQGVDHGIDEAFADEEQAALDGLRALLGKMWHWGADDAARVSRMEFADRLRHACRTTPLSRPRPAYGVSCLDLESVRRLRFDYVFLIGMNQGVTPSPPPVNAIYPESDRRRLRAAGIELENARTHVSREMLLFHHVFDVPRRSLVLSWHAVARSGKETAASPYLQDVFGLFPELTTQRAHAQREIVAPPPGQIASKRDLQNAVFAPGSGVAQDAFEGLDAIAAGVAIETARHDDSDFGAFDGALQSVETLGALSEHYGLSHSFSVNQIETYASCPFRFFVERVLRIEEAEIPDEAFDARVRGRILHSVLEAFHRGYRDRPLSAVPLAAALGSMREIVESRFDELAWQSANVSRGVLAVERARLLELLERYVRLEHARGESDWKPAHFEVSFGSVRDASGDPMSNPEPFVLETPAGPVRFAGQIDRIDVSDGAARIIDYKSSRAPEPKDIQSGLSIQLTLYALALEHYLDPDRECAEALFLVPGQVRHVEGLGKESNSFGWEERQDVLFETLARCIAGIRNGRFPPTERGNACAYCPRERACRHDRARIARKLGHG